MKENLNPFAALILYCVDIAAAEYSSGKMTYDEAIDYGVKLANEYADSEEFDKIVEKYFSDFVNTKDLKLGEKNVYTQGDTKC